MFSDVVMSGKKIAIILAKNSVKLFCDEFDPNDGRIVDGYIHEYGTMAWRHGVPYAISPWHGKKMPWWQKNAMAP